MRLKTLMSMSPYSSRRNWAAGSDSVLERHLSGKEEHTVLEYEAGLGWKLLSLKNLTRN